MGNLEKRTSCVEFSFNNIMFRQIDDVGPALANIFVVYFESKLFASNLKTFLYQRYVDDIFSIFLTRKFGYRKQFKTTVRTIGNLTKF